ncbi:branched-chain amino acid ABC transporter permease [Pyrobaculum neutrophilum]|uniref:Inner-membrane translocator n=1 Tax=Pyrobaculum neutrophilum (strain DSM 2338 / JCM 9278 / NBRC 100436 / V24Sta) TaxID=444157 RepID=B1Y9V6_PYRNV|nr:branched-chain amino acid ABC transporter permease [Pyrobaculum neutrophilum]ACB40506.1 inner-membrane translocator [Pyrobaculum neutrophilum V24Sta]
MGLFGVDYNTLASAIIFSNIYVLLSLGLNLTYITTKIPSFAHGDLATVGAYISYFAIYFLLMPYLSQLGIPVNVYLTFPLVALAGGAVAVLSYLLVFRPMIKRGAGITPLMIASFGLHFVIFASVALAADYVQSRYGVLTRNVLLSRWELIWPGTDFLTSSLINTTLSVVVTTALLYVLLYRTRYGVIMRASIDNLYLARAVGINVERVFAVAWLLIGAVTGIAGVYMAMYYPMSEELGWLRLALVFVASVVGGLSNIYGAVLGGYVVGLSMVLGAAYILTPLNIPTEFQLAIPFAFVIAILLFAPQGLVGVISQALQRARG